MILGYLFLSLSLVSGAIKGFCGKKISGFAVNIRSAVLLNLCRMFICILLSLAFIIVTGDIKKLNFDAPIILTSALSGVGISVFVVSWLIAVRKSAYMMIDVFLMLGTLVPIICGGFMFGERIDLKQIAGFTILLLAVLIMCSYNNEIKIKLPAKTVGLLIVCGFANGVMSAAQKIFARHDSFSPVSVFNLYTYVFAFLFLTVFYALMPKNVRVKFDRDGTKNPVLYLLVMALSLMLNSYFITLAAAYLDSVRLYPLTQGGALIISTFMASVFFKEKLTLRAVFGILLSFAALLMINT